MKYSFIISEDAAHFLNKLRNEKLKLRLERAIQELLSIPRPPKCKKIQGANDTYRIRVGDYRIIYEINDGTITILVLAIGHRKEIYD